MLSVSFRVDMHSFNSRLELCMLLLHWNGSWFTFRFGHAKKKLHVY